MSRVQTWLIKLSKCESFVAALLDFFYTINIFFSFLALPYTSEVLVRFKHTNWLMLTTFIIIKAYPYILITKGCKLRLQIQFYQNSICFRIFFVQCLKLIKKLYFFLWFVTFRISVLDSKKDLTALYFTHGVVVSLVTTNYPGLIQFINVNFIQTCVQTSNKKS